MITERLTRIEQKVKQLASKMEQLQKLNVALEEENRKLKSSMAVLKEKLDKPAQNIAVTPPVAATPATNNNDGTDEKRSRKLKKEINQYIKEIDKCIEWLQHN